jgi:hypothetical protein
MGFFSATRIFPVLLKYERRVHMWRDEEKEREEQWERDREY